MIRCIRPGYGGLKRRQIFPKYKVKGGVREAVISWVSYSFR